MAEKPPKVELKSRFEDLLELEARLVRLEELVPTLRAELQRLRATIYRWRQEEEEEEEEIEPQTPRVIEPETPQYKAGQSLKPP